MDLKLQLEHHRLTTAEIFYFMPDHPLLLQTYIWQELDLAPEFPLLFKFLNFWERELEGRLHSVDICSVEHIKPATIILARGEVCLH
ncbi:MAG: Usg protein [Rickettsiales bacterium]|jgi:uncharacterized protein Usg|nr:Usg protein [Rickettsiales bacterium]